MGKYVPLSNTFTLVAIIGFILAFWNTLFIPSFVPANMNDIWLKWGFTFTFMFVVFIIASVVSVDPQ